MLGVYAMTTIRYVCTSVIIRNVLARRKHAICSQPAKNKFALIFGDVTCTYHHNIRRVYNLNCQLLHIIKIITTNITTFTNILYPKLMYHTAGTVCGSIICVGNDWSCLLYIKLYYKFVNMYVDLSLLYELGWFCSCPSFCFHLTEQAHFVTWNECKSPVVLVGFHH